MKQKIGKLGPSRAKHLSASDLRKAAQKLTFDGTRAFIAQERKAGRW